MHRDEEWENSFRINVLGNYRFIDAAAPHLMADGGGAIVNLTTLTARPSKAGSKAHGFPTYAVTKAALERLTSYLAVELGEQGVCVNAISPGHAEYYMRDGRQPDIDYWGSPMVHLVAQRMPDGSSWSALRMSRRHTTCPSSRARTSPSSTRWPTSSSPRG